MTGNGEFIPIIMVMTGGWCVYGIVLPTLLGIAVPQSFTFHGEGRQPIRIIGEETLVVDVDIFVHEYLGYIFTLDTAYVCMCIY